MSDLTLMSIIILRYLFPIHYFLTPSCTIYTAHRNTQSTTSCFLPFSPLPSFLPSLPFPIHFTLHCIALHLTSLYFTTQYAIKRCTVYHTTLCHRRWSVSGGRHVRPLPRKNGRIPSLLQGVPIQIIQVRHLTAANSIQWRQCCVISYILQFIATWYIISVLLIQFNDVTAVTFVLLNYTVPKRKKSHSFTLILHGCWCFDKHDVTLYQDVCCVQLNGLALWSVLLRKWIYYYLG